MELGFEQRVGITSAEMLEQLPVFGEHEQAWRGVEVKIIAAREEYNESAPRSAER